MDVIGKQIIKGTVEKQLKMFSEEPEETQEEEGEEDVEADLEEKQRRREMMNEKKEKMLRQQAKRRADRAKTREEIRSKHNLKSSEEDKEIIRDSSKTTSFFSRSDSSDEDEFDLSEAASNFADKIKETWEQFKTSISGPT